MAGQPAVSYVCYGYKIAANMEYRAIAAVWKASYYGFNVFLQNISLEGEVVGHPYARAHKEGSYAGAKPWQVHRLTSGLQTFGPIVGGGLGRQRMIIGKWGLADTPLAHWIVYGTTKMKPRDVVWKSLGQARKHIQEIFREELKGLGTRK